MRAISAALRNMAAAFDRLAPVMNAPAPAAAKVAGPRTGRKLNISPARRAELKLQGQYMGYMRNLKPRQKKRVKDIYASRGIRAAIAAAKRMSP
jgi:hypothetical protein